MGSMGIPDYNFQSNQFTIQKLYNDIYQGNQNSNQNTEWHPVKKNSVVRRCPKKYFDSDKKEISYQI